MYKLLIVGRTASGKDTIANELVKAGLKPVVSFTTRPKREGEGDTHQFITGEEAALYTDKVATTEINGYQYFATKEQVEESDFYIIDPNGVTELTHNMPETLFRLLYVESDEDIRRSRFMARDPQNGRIFHKRNASENEQFTQFESALSDRAIGGENLLQYRIMDNSGNNAYLDIASALLMDRNVFTQIRKIVETLAEDGNIHRREDGKLAFYTDEGTQYLSLDNFTENVLSDNDGIAAVILSYLNTGRTFAELATDVPRKVTVTNFEHYLCHLTKEAFVDSMILHCDGCPIYPCKDVTELPSAGTECAEILTEWCRKDYIEGE